MLSVKRILSTLCISAMLMLWSAVLPAQMVGTSKAEYLQYTERTAKEYLTNLTGQQEEWRKAIHPDAAKGYRPNSNEVYLAALCANLYEITKKTEYLDAVKTILVNYAEYKDLYPKGFYKTRPEYEAGLPALPNMFTFGKFVHAYHILNTESKLTEKEQNIIESQIAEGANFIIRDQEWGPMNRSMLRAEGLLYAAKALNNHPDQSNWVATGKALLNDNLSQWNIEDASMYHGIWLYSMVGYSNYIAEDDRLYKLPFLQYYHRYNLELLSPAAVIPDFGDATWKARWYLYLAFFENGASKTNDPNLRWAASEMFDRHLAERGNNIHTAMVLSDACRWANFEQESKVPDWGSREVLDDIIGKKIVFRDGWAADGTYMLLNYRDEGDGGYLYREYLRNTLTVNEEKMHHGHADENSVVLLMKNKSVLLHDGGYRDYQPSGPFGAYRADYFHNRVVVRKNKIALGQDAGEFKYSTRAKVEGQSVLDFLHNAGTYREVSTKKIDFISLKHFDMSRTRVVDEKLGYESDRIVNYIKDLGYFVIIDVVKFTEEDDLTMANLWHTREILSKGDNWFDTRYDSLGRHAVGGDERLLIYFPEDDRLAIGTEEQRRYKQKEHLMYQVAARHGARGDLQVFVTVLIPHHKTLFPEELVKGITLVKPDKYPRAVGVSIKTAGKEYLIGTKLDIGGDMIRDWRRPKYTWESGKITYGDYETDGANLFVVDGGKKIHYAVVGATKIKREGKILYEQKGRNYKFNTTGAPDEIGFGKFRYWEAEISK